MKMLTKMIEDHASDNNYVDKESSNDNRAIQFHAHDNDVVDTEVR